MKNNEYRLLSSEQMTIEVYSFKYEGTSFLIKVYVQGRKWVDMEMLEPENYGGDEEEVFDALDNAIG